jgi:hypothetical protein
MINSREEIKKELESLIDEGTSLIKNALSNYEEKKDPIIDSSEYQYWYTKALSVVRQLIPDRLYEFEELYKMKKRKEIDYTTYTISDYLLGLSIVHHYTKEETLNREVAFLTKFRQQLAIIQSAHTRLDSILSDVVGIIRAELFDNEIDSAISLTKANYLRAAGTIAGVVLERHLFGVCYNHTITVRKKNPTITTYNDLLKDSRIIDVPTWRFIQRLGDIRNLCTHAKERDPTKEEIDELIKGVKKIVKTLF